MDTSNKCSNCTIGSCALPTLTKSQVKEMENHTLQTSFKKGEILRRQAAPLPNIIYLRKGYVKEFVSHENNPDQVIQLIKPQSYIGLQGLCTNTSSVFSYQAITNIEVCYIEKETFGSLIKENGLFAREILIALSHESLSNQKRFLGLNQKQIYGKVAGLILYLCEEVYESSEFNLHVNRIELSQMIACTRESVTKALIWFRKEKLISMEKNHIKILDKSRIEEMAIRG